MFDLAPRLRHNLRNRTAFNGTSVEVACPVCAHAVTFAPKATLVTCGQCLTPLLRGPDDDHPLPPTSILPFGISESAADARLREHVPEARNPKYVLTWERVFVPYWRFALHVRCPWRQQTHYRDAITDSHVVDTDSGVFEEDIDHEFPAASLPDDRGLLETFAPPALGNAVPYAPAHLSGTPVQPVTIGLEDAWAIVRTRVDTRVEAAVKKEAGLWVDLPEELVTNMSHEQAALVLVPLIVGTGRHGTGTDRFLVDGHSGQTVKATTPAAGRGGDRAPKREMGLGVALLVLGGLAAVVVLLLWAAFAVGRALLATRM